MAASVPRAAHDLETRTRTDDVLVSENIDFGSLLLSQAVLTGLAAAGFQKPSPIQLKAIPLGRCGLDLIVQAKSGTGKTCVFSTIALDSLVLENTTTQVLVLAPTREIAVQIHSVVMAIGSAMEGLECHVFIGGQPVSQDKQHLKKCHIAIGSPGRIKQLIELGMLSTASIRLFVLDEADKLLEEGSFQEQINWIFSSLPVNKQMLALSATYPESLAQHLARYMREPTFVRLNPNDPGLKGLKQYYKLVQCHALPHKVFEEKVQHLLELFSKVPFNQALVFSNLHTRAQQLADILSSKGLPAVCISGGLSQSQRLEAMSKLKQYQCRVLISTDLTSRGIDAEKVNLVINLDVPQDWETYMHRIGRAGRFGTQGLAVTYCCHGEEENKMMAIAQKCSLNLAALPSPIEPGLMEETCDWDVNVEASAPGSMTQLFPKKEKKRHAKIEVLSAASSRAEEPSNANPEINGPSQRGRRRPTPKPAVKVEEMPGKLPPTVDVPLAAAQATAHCQASQKPTYKELQEALPKIPPLSSFKSQLSKFMTFEEAELDFQSFITEGLGRSVEVIRQFKGQGENDGDNSQNGYQEVQMLYDDEDQPFRHMRSLRSKERPPPRTKSPPVQMNADFPPPGLSPGSSTSGSDTEEDQQDEELLGNPDKKRGTQHGAAGQPHSDAGHASAAEPKATSTRAKSSLPSAPQTRRHAARATETRALLPSHSSDSSSEVSTSRQTDRGAPPQRRDEGRRTKREIRKEREKWEQRGEEQKRGRDERVEAEHEDEDEEWTNESSWSAYYRAWQQHYSSHPSSPQHGYCDYYSLAHSWMAIYRMNAVYMEELLRH
ncbi:probable ATP-dependent RNA helicase DDX20 [Lampris incognitus]|uniref:probable ATP-dependent RNA helicase DDX20 n=1 Tax=Lampris incognitus TaxID=2546036 RepID=UPI0024B56FA4|nr:probable ATP-dependent RNA helicase DDX20 [Lampris incognitus]